MTIEREKMDITKVFHNIPSGFLKRGTKSEEREPQQGNEYYQQEQDDFNEDLKKKIRETKDEVKDKGVALREINMGGQSYIEILDSSGKVLRTCCASEFIKLQGMSSKDRKDRGKLLDQKI